MPQVGLGTWLSNPFETKAAVKTAIETGYRLIDTAALYGNEGSVGEAIKEMIQAGKITREELFVTTKMSLFMHTPNHRSKVVWDGKETSWASAPSDMEDPNVKQLAVKYSKTPAQILLRYLMERNIAIIPKSVTPSRIVENFESQVSRSMQSEGTRDNSSEFAANSEDGGIIAESRDDKSDRCPIKEEEEPKEKSLKESSPARQPRAQNTSVVFCRVSTYIRRQIRDIIFMSKDLLNMDSNFDKPQELQAAMASPKKGNEKRDFPKFEATKTRCGN
ncbi:oxidoreductase, aldo/keto reductase family protein [Teladorsagia circumcincta]|uniref:Oxidoreductase, aldo/keto reductase family protein n=1 Tax=Teladorsagia circumcincta TaxID=45464 RepID=A0A2G9UBV7_TELCI|nr:oxidoreductase, aldo/keto reductase family protein [Teladorsagia circumcincta]